MRVAGIVALLLVAWVSMRARSPELEVGAWLTYWDLDRGLARLERDPGRRLDDAFLFAGALSSEGGVILTEDENTIRAAAETTGARGIRVWLTIVNDVHSADPGTRAVLKDAELVHRLLSDPGRMAAHRDQIVALARDLSVDGVDIDYENLDASDRDRFTAFVAALAESLRREGISLSVTVQPKTRATSSRGSGAADWAALCPLVDRLQIMLYNLHSAKTGPGPMATSEWMSKVLAFAVTECGTSFDSLNGLDGRLVPVLKVSGMEWSPNGTRGIHFDECIELAREKGVSISRDERDRVPHFTYVTKEGLSTVYFEDATSIETKVDHLRGLGFSRVLLWSLGREDPEILRRILP